MKPAQFDMKLARLSCFLAQDFCIFFTD